MQQANTLIKFILEVLESEQNARRMKLDLPIPNDLHDIANAFKAAGEELYVVGGAVRDTLIGKTPKDYDLVTGANPDRVIEITSQIQSNKVDLTGKAFGVVRVWTKQGNEYEIATFRKDIGAGRRPDSVEFTTIEQDVKRRDLTINALFYDIESGEVVDYVDGIDDVLSGNIKAVGDPTIRFEEDKLRILRVARFAGRMGSEPDPDTKAAILRNNDLSEVSPERIHDEFLNGIASSKSVQHFFDIIGELQLWPQILPGFEVNPNTGTESRYATVQLAVLLLSNDPKKVTNTLHKMKYSSEEVDTVSFLIQLTQISAENAPRLKKEFNRIRMNPDIVREFASAIGMKNSDAFLEFASNPPAADSRELMAKGLKGPEIGQAMAKAESEAYQSMIAEVRKFIRAVIREWLN